MQTGYPRRQRNRQPWATISRILLEPRLQYVLIFVSALTFAALLFSGFLLFRYSDTQDLLNRGKQQMAEGKVALAAKTFQLLVSRDPNHYEGHIRLGQAFLELDDKRKAEQAFKVATLLKTESGKNSPSLRGGMDDTLATIAVSKLALARGQYALAQEKLDALMETQKKTPASALPAELREALFDLHTSWADALYSDPQQWPNAIIHYKKAMPYAPNYALEDRFKDKLVQLMQQQADKLLQADPQSDRAVALVKESLRYQYSMDTLVRLADLYESQDQLDEALVWYRKAFEANPETMSLKYTNLLIKKGRQLVDEAKPEEAAAYFEEARRIGEMAQLGQDQLFPVAVHSLRLQLEDANPYAQEFRPVVQFRLENRADKPLDFLVGKVVFYSGDRKLAEVEQPLLNPPEVLQPLYNPPAKAPAPLDGKAPIEAEKQKPASVASKKNANAKTITLKLGERLTTHQLKGRPMTVKVYVAYQEGESQQWYLKALRDVRVVIALPPKPKEETETPQHQQPEMILTPVPPRSPAPPRSPVPSRPPNNNNGGGGAPPVPPAAPLPG